MREVIGTGVPRRENPRTVMIFTKNSEKVNTYSPHTPSLESKMPQEDNQEKKRRRKIRQFQMSHASASKTTHPHP